VGSFDYAFEVVGYKHGPDSADKLKLAPHVGERGRMSFRNNRPGNKRHRKDSFLIIVGDASRLLLDGMVWLDSINHMRRSLVF
jgi:hypothetical protein